MTSASKKSNASPSNCDSAAMHQRLLEIAAEAVVRPSFVRCCQHGDTFFDAFYSALSDRIPEVGPKFANTEMTRQNALIREGINALIDYAAGSTSAALELTRLGEVHNRDQIDIPPQMYPGWIDALMQAVAEFDPERTDILETAWREVVGPGIERMISLY